MMATTLPSLTASMFTLIHFNGILVMLNSFKRSSRISNHGLLINLVFHNNAILNQLKRGWKCRVSDIITLFRGQIIQSIYSLSKTPRRSPEAVKLILASNLSYNSLSSVNSRLMHIWFVSQWAAASRSATHNTIKILLQRADRVKFSSQHVNCR